MNLSHKKEMSLYELWAEGVEPRGIWELGTAICSELPEQEVAATVVTTKRLRVLLEEDHLLDCS